MARRVPTDREMQRVMRNRSSMPRGPLQTSPGRVIPLDKKESELAFLEYQHPVYRAWRTRWEQNEARLAGGDEVIDELRPFVWEQDFSPTGQFAKRQEEAIYTNFPDIFTAAITAHLIRFAPRPDAGLTIPSLGKITGRSNKPSRAEQVYYSVDNPSGAGSEWNPWWMDVAKRAAATGHRWLYVDTPDQAPLNREEERTRGLRPYVTEFSPIDVPSWYINPRGIIEFVVIRPYDEDPTMSNGGFNVVGQAERGYLLLVRAGVTRLGERFQAGGWWRFSPDKAELSRNTWDDTFGEIPISILFYQKHKGTRNYPGISRPGTTELGQAAVAHMNQTSSANYNSWAAGGGVDYLAGIDEEGMDLVREMEIKGSRRIPLIPHSETDVVPTVTPSSSGAVQADIFTMREESIWRAAIRLGIIEASAPISGSGAATEAGFKAGQMPRIVWVAQNLAECQNNIIRYIELRYGIANPTGQAVWPVKFELVELVDRIRKFFETERLSGIRSETADSRAMVQASEDAGLFADPEERNKFLGEYKASAKRRNELELAAAAEMTKPTDPRRAIQNAAREAGKKVDKGRGQPGRRGPKQRPVQPPAPGVKR